MADPNSNTAVQVIKIGVGAATIGVMAWKLPILEILYATFTLLFLPLAFLASIGLIGDGMVGLLGGSFNTFAAQLKQRVDHHRDNLNKGTAPPSGDTQETPA